MGPIRIQLDESTTPPVLSIEGEIDLATADEVRDTLDRVLAADPKVVVDLGGVTFLGAVGIRTLLGAAATLNGSGPLEFVNARRLAWLLEVVGLETVETIRFSDAA